MLDIQHLWTTRLRLSRIWSATSFGSSTSTIWIGIVASDAQYWIAWCMQSGWFCCGRSRQWRQRWQRCARWQIGQWATAQGVSVVANDATMGTYRRRCLSHAISMEDFALFRWQLNWYIGSWLRMIVFIGLSVGGYFLVAFFFFFFWISVKLEFVNC